MDAKPRSRSARRHAIGLPPLSSLFSLSSILFLSSLSVLLPPQGTYPSSAAYSPQTAYSARLPPPRGRFSSSSGLVSSKRFTPRKSPYPLPPTIPLLRRTLLHRFQEAYPPSSPLGQFNPPLLPLQQPNFLKQLTLGTSILPSSLPFSPLSKAAFIHLERINLLQK